MPSVCPSGSAMAAGGPAAAASARVAVGPPQWRRRPALGGGELVGPCPASAAHHEARRGGAGLSLPNRDGQCLCGRPATEPRARRPAQHRAAPAGHAGGAAREACKGHKAGRRAAPPRRLCCGGAARARPERGIPKLQAPCAAPFERAASAPPWRRAGASVEGRRAAPRRLVASGL
ncbi:MAG: hypothetical protein J3K34DRAFT_438892 [Monoraphidium minutum]|nr:MAG: hypothetical protein J3K34DRAFT_438892 [Monoraphidium minutum]